MPGEGSWVGLDVHARSVVGCAIDESAGEVRTQRIGARTDQIVDWVRAQPGPVSGLLRGRPDGVRAGQSADRGRGALRGGGPFEAGATGRGQVKTDRRDAERLARLLRIGEVPGVRVPTEAEEAVRDLVRAREDCRSDLMRARHRLSKLLLRQGLVWEQSAWTGAHEDWLRGQRFDRRGVQLAFDEALDTVFRSTRAGTVSTLRSTRWPRPTRVGRPGGAAALSARGLDVDRHRVVRRGRRLAPVHRLHDRGLSRAGALGVLLRGPAGSGRDHQDRQRSRPPAAGRGRLAPPPPPAHQPGTRPTRRRPARRGPGSGRGRGRRLHQRWCRLEARNKRPTVSVVAVARELAGWCWSLAVLENDQPTAI